IEDLDVNNLERVGNDTRQIATLEDILLVLKAEFEALREMTKTTIEETRALQPQIEQGQFVATVLDMSTPFNQAKISLGFGRGITETFMSTACHATIVAVEATWPLGFEFLREAKTDSLAPNGDDPAYDAAADADASDSGAEYTIGLHDIYYTPLELSIPANEAVTITLQNFGEAQHNLTIAALGISVDVAPGEIGSTTVNAPPGEYDYFCSSPGHRAGGMVGMLLVE
ncbi:MAG: cupredoxin domain-containing protein, partial [Thermomicrobiales bacterium]